MGVASSMTYPQVWPIQLMPVGLGDANRMLGNLKAIVLKRRLATFETKEFLDSSLSSIRSVFQNGMCQTHAEAPATSGAGYLEYIAASNVDQRCIIHPNKIHHSIAARIN